MNLNFSDFIKVQCNISQHTCSFLLDTQAEISIIKISSLHKAILFDSSDYIDIKGVTDQLIRTLGSINAELLFPEQSLFQHLYIVPDDFDIPSDGILGKNFLKKYQCDLSYSTATLTMHTYHGPIYTEIFEGPDEETLIIPPRCEIIRKFNIKSPNSQKLRFVYSQQIAKDVFTSNTIVDTKNAFIRVINVSDHSRIISRNKITTHNMDNYDKTTDERTNNVVELLSKGTYVKSDFSKLCTNYADVFALCWEFYALQ